MWSWNHRTVSSRARRLKTPILALIFLLALGSRHGSTEQTDEDKRLREFSLKSRQQMKIVPSPTPAPKRTPSPASCPLKQGPQSESGQKSAPPTEKKTASPSPKEKRDWVFFSKRDDDGSIVVQKSGAQEKKDLVPASGDGGGHWQYLTPAVRKAIDDASVGRNRWKFIIVHNSGTRQGRYCSRPWLRYLFG